MKKDGAFSYFSRDLSWIEFNARVLDEARQGSVPLLERLRFLTIVSSNFDEFFMVRVASLKEQLVRAPELRDEAGLRADEQLSRISKRVHALVDIQYECLLGEILPGLAREGIVYVSPSEYSREHAAFLDAFFMSDVFPLLTPLRTGSSALPSIANLRLHAAFLLRNDVAVPQGPLASFLERTGVIGSKDDESEIADGSSPLAIVQIPASIPRVV